MTTHPVTLAVRQLREGGVKFSPLLYRYRGARAEVHAAELGIDPMRLGKTIILRDADDQALVVVMCSPWEIATKALARHIGSKRVEPVAPARAESLSGYRIGGISPFGQRTPLATYAQLELFGFETIFVNGGQRGFLVELAPDALARLLAAELIDCATR